MSTTNIITYYNYNHQNSEFIVIHGPLDHSSANLETAAAWTQELDAFISVWEETAKRQPLPRAPAKAPKPPRRGPKERAPQGGVRRGGRERAQSLQAKFQAGFQTMKNEWNWKPQRLRCELWEVCWWFRTWTCWRVHEHQIFIIHMYIYLYIYINI